MYPATLSSNAGLEFDLRGRLVFSSALCDDGRCLWPLMVLTRTIASQFGGVKVTTVLLLLGRRQTDQKLALAFCARYPRGQATSKWRHDPMAVSRAR